MDDHRLPLASQLFQTRFGAYLKRYPECTAVVPYLQNPPVSVESSLQQLLDESPYRPARLSQFMALRYYLQNLIADFEHIFHDHTCGLSNYATLIDQILQTSPKPKALLVTFNYDRLIEYALNVHGLRLTALKDYISDSKLRLVKLHGSVGWAREAVVPFENIAATPETHLIASYIERAGSITLSNNYHLVDPRRSIARLDNQPLVPAIAMPTEKTKTYECPDDHLNALEAMLPNVRRVLIVGWRAADQHFLDLLRKHQVDRFFFHVVAESERACQEIADRITRSGIQGKHLFFGRGFSDYVVNRHGEDLFRQG